MLRGVEQRMGAVPAIGEHTTAILVDLGRGKKEIEKLRATGIV
jgi:formyl-CoA transferase